MTPTFTITIEPERKLLRVTLGGFFDLQDVIALENEKRAALLRLGCAQNEHLSLIDVSGCKLQSQDVVQAFQSAIGDKRYMSKRIAFVTGSSLARMQVRRMLERKDAAFFETVEAAEAWLFEADAQAAQ
jgi:hypothetical protein